MYNSTPHESGWKSVVISTLWNCCNDAPQYSLQITRMWSIQLRATLAPTNNEVEVPRKCDNICGLLLKRFLCFSVWRHKLCHNREFILYGYWHLIDRALIGFSTNWVVPLPEWQCINVARCTLMRRLTVNEVQTLREMWTWWDQHPDSLSFEFVLAVHAKDKIPHSKSSITFESLLPLPPNHINLSSQTNLA